MIFNMITGGSANALTGFVSNVKWTAQEKEGSTSIYVWWTDPEDDSWAGTRLVRKEGDYPSNASDGEIVVDSKVRNQYNYVSEVSAGYEDSGLETGKTYYYCLFPYSKSNQFTSDVSGQFTAVALQMSFTITFMCEGEEKYKYTANRGEIPTYSGEEISTNKEGNRSFDDWSPKPYPADKDQTYDATFKCILTYKKYDDSAILHTEQVKHGESGVWEGTDTRGATASATYTFAGWTTMPNGAYEPEALTNIQEDKTVYSAFTATAKKYTVTWKNIDGATLKTEQVEYGKVPSYTGSTPSFNGWRFTGWNPTPKAVTGPATYYATYTMPSGMTETITKPWEDIVADSTANRTSGYTEGGTKVLITTDSKARCYELVGINKETAGHFSFVPKTVDGTCTWNPRNNTNGYPQSGYKSYIEGTCGNHMPAVIKNNAKTVTKYCYSYSPRNNNQSYTAKFWPPNVREMNFGQSGYETEGPQYTYYNSNARRIRYTDTGSAQWAWLSSTRADIQNLACRVHTDGSFGGDHVSQTSGALPGFCL